MLEVHFIYGNSAENKRINQAGFVIDYSPTLRQHDMGAFVMVRAERCVWETRVRVRVRVRVRFKDDVRALDGVRRGGKEGRMDRGRNAG